MGHAVLESYSRVLESLAAAILNRVDDVVYADALAVKSSSGSEPEENLTPGTPTSMTLLDFMGWNIDQGEAKKNPGSDFDEYLKEHDHEKIMAKTPENKKISYLEKLEHWGGLRSPTARH